MAKQKPRNESQSELRSEGITRITVGGFKSIAEEQRIEIRPLTILAGVNSSGKSSIMQPLLLLKQTLEATYDPGALLLSGSNVRFTSTDQLLTHLNNGKTVDTFHVGVEGEPGSTLLTTYFTRGKNKGFDVTRTIQRFGKEQFDIHEGLSQGELQAILKSELRVNNANLELSNLASLVTVSRDRCFLMLSVNLSDNPITTPIMPVLFGNIFAGAYFRNIIHLPGLRGNPQRTYPVTAVGSGFPGTFENYVASIVGQWQSEANNDKLRKVNNDLLRLGLAGHVSVRSIDDTQVELQVNRFPHSSKNDSQDMVSIADVGLGVSQTLPVIVALHASETDQLIYLEQPEIHLHPRAQSAMAEVLADAALQGKRLVVETHSSLLLLGIQTLVAEGKLPPELVKLHWFTLQEDGSTKITSADLDETGAFGDWPEDFATVALESEDRYLDAAQKSLKGK